MPHLESGYNPDQVASVHLDSDRDRRLNPVGLAARADAMVESIHAKGGKQATALANSLGGELDSAIEADLLRAETNLAKARNALARRLAGFADAAVHPDVPSPALEGYEHGDERAGTVEEIVDREYAVAYLNSPASKQLSFEQNIAYFEAKGINATEAVLSFVEAGRWREVIEQYDMSTTDGEWIYGAIAAATNGLERLASEYPQRNFLGIATLMSVFSGPDGVNRVLRHADLFKDIEYYLSHWTTEIKANPNPNPAVLLDAIKYFSNDRYLLENLSSSLESCQGISERDDSVREKAVETALLLAKNGSASEALRVINAMGMEREFAGNHEFANALNVAFGDSPDVILPLLDQFPLVGPLLKSNERARDRIITGWLLNHLGPGRPPIVREAVDAYGITWRHALRNWTVEVWLGRPMAHGGRHEKLTNLIELLLPSREERLLFADSALMVELRQKSGAFDAETFQSVHETFDLSPEERVAYGPSEVGYRLIREQLGRPKSEVSHIVVGIVSALDSGKDAFLAKMKSPEMQALAWQKFEVMMARREFAVAGSLDVFGLSAEEMAKKAREEYFNLLRDGTHKSYTEKLLETFDVFEEEIPRSEIDLAIREGIDTCIRASSLSMLANFVESRDVSPVVAAASAAEVQGVERMAVHNLDGYFSLSDGARAA